MVDQRRRERLSLDETVELTLIEPDCQNKGPLIVDEMSFEFGRKFGVHLNLLLTGLRFSGDINLDIQQEISFQVPEQQEPLKGSVTWKKEINESASMYGIKVLRFLDRRRNERGDLDESVEMTLIEPNPPENCAIVIEEVSYGLGRKRGVYLSPLITGVRFRSNMDFNQGQTISFQVPSQTEVLQGAIVWKERKDDTYTLYGVQVS